MSESEAKKQSTATREEDGRGARKPYVKPEVRCEVVFETLALSCGKISGQGGACRTVRKNS